MTTVEVARSRDSADVFANARPPKGVNRRQVEATCDGDERVNEALVGAPISGGVWEERVTAGGEALVVRKLLVRVLDQVKRIMKRARC